METCGNFSAKSRDTSANVSSFDKRPIIANVCGPLRSITWRAHKYMKIKQHQPMRAMANEGVGSYG